MPDEELECLEGPSPLCDGPVEPRSVDGLTWWPRCEYHFALRLKKQEEINELTSPIPAAWYDKSYAGEEWDEDQ